jgi:MYXO-CTERM domain-containing protein
VSGPRAAFAGRAFGFVCALGLVGAAPARATTCARPDVLDAVPPDGAANVPPNASLFAHYDASAEYGGEDVVLTPPGGVDEVVEVTWDGTQGLLTFAPDAPLAPGSYTLAWPSLRGLNAAALGKGAIVHFTVGTTDDIAPPDFAGLTGVTWDLERETNDCTDSLEDRFVFTLTLAPADDDGGRDGLTLVVFQSSGSGVDGGSIPVLTAAMPAAGTGVTVKLAVGDATGHVCFAAIARDLTGKISSSGARTVCVDTTAPPFFRGCAVAPAGGGEAGMLSFAGLALAFARSRRRARAST